MAAEREKNEKKAEKTLGTRLAACLLALLTVCGAAALPGCAKTEADTEPAVSETDVVSEADVPEEEPKKIVHPSMRFDNSYIRPEDLETGEGNVIGGASRVCRCGDWIYYTWPSDEDWGNRPWMRISADGHVREQLEKVMGKSLYNYTQIITRNGKLYFPSDGTACSSILIYDPADDSVQRVDAGGYDKERSPYIVDMCADDEYLYYAGARWNPQASGNRAETFICKMPLDGGTPQKLCEIDMAAYGYRQQLGFDVYNGKIYMTLMDNADKSVWLTEVDAESGEIKLLYKLPYLRYVRNVGICIGGGRLCIYGSSEMTISAIDGSDKITVPSSINTTTAIMAGSKVIYANNLDNIGDLSNRICCYDIDTGESTVVLKNGSRCYLRGTDGIWAYFEDMPKENENSSRMVLRRVRLDGTGLMEMP